MLGAVGQGKQKMNKILVTGSGRSGTTFLMQILTACNLDTGYTNKSIQESIDKTNSGAEWPLHDGTEFPRIIKNPGFCIHLPSTMQRFHWKVDFVYVSIRKYDSVVKHYLDESPALNKSELIRGVSHHVGMLIQHLEFLEIPHTFIQFPRSVNEPDYLYFKLISLLNGKISLPEFRDIHSRIADKNKVRF